LGSHTRVIAALLVPLLVLGPSCAARSDLIVRTDRGEAVKVDLENVHPVEYDKADLQVAMGLLAEHVAAVIQRQGGKLRVRLVSRDPMVEAYLGWCERRDSPGDCLDVLDASSPGLSSSAKRSIALRMALGTALQEVAEAVRKVDPVKVEALMLVWFAIYLASFVAPDVTVTKALNVIMTANMIAFLGWDGFRSFILGYCDMAKAADAAQTFSQLDDAGRAFGRRMGPSMVRIVTALVTLGLSAATGMATPPPVTSLPGGAQAVANAGAQGFRLSAVSGGSVSISSSGLVTLVLAAQATVPERGGAPEQIAGVTSGTETGIAARVRWKGFSKGKLQDHFRKHGSEFGNVTQEQYLQAAKSFAAETGPAFQEGQVGNFVVKYDPATGRLLVGHVGDREIRTFYRALKEAGDPFAAAMDLARKLVQ